MKARPAGSVTRALTRSLLVGLTLLWLGGVVGSGFVLKRLIDERSDDELQESAAMLMSLVRYSDDLLITAAMLGESRPRPGSTSADHHFGYLIRDAAGRVMLHSPDIAPEVLETSVAEGFADAGGWRVYTVKDADKQRFVQLAEPLGERREALLTSLLWLTVPLAVLLAFAVLILLRASRSLVVQVQVTATAVSRQDPQALSLLPLDGVVTEMRPAVEATNRLLRRLADALEAERSFTYNSAHELRTPIAGALAQAQVIAAMSESAELKSRADALVLALGRLARLAERLLALARAEGQEPLADDWVDLAQVVRLTADEFAGNPRLRGRRIDTAIAPARVRGDLDAVGLALRNLVENALVHGTPGTFIRIACGATAGTAWIEVTDDGPGVEGIDVATLVKRFARGAGASGRDAGAGLGLSIVDMLARRMGAVLELASPRAEGRGGFAARLLWPAAMHTGT
jgi:two-component system OmpR family sensor kinase